MPSDWDHDQNREATEELAAYLFQSEGRAQREGDDLLRMQDGELHADIRADRKTDDMTRGNRERILRGFLGVYRERRVVTHQE